MRVCVCVCVCVDVRLNSISHGIYLYTVEWKTWTLPSSEAEAISGYLLSNLNQTMRIFDGK